MGIRFLDSPSENTFLSLTLAFYISIPLCAKFEGALQYKNKKMRAFYLFVIVNLFSLFMYFDKISYLLEYLCFYIHLVHTLHPFVLFLLFSLVFHNVDYVFFVQNGEKHLMDKIETIALFDYYEVKLQIDDEKIEYYFPSFRNSFYFFIVTTTNYTSL